MISEKEYKKFLLKCTPKQHKFIDSYLSTFDVHAAAQAAGYLYKSKYKEKAIWWHLSPYIMFRLNQMDLGVTRQWLIGKWMEYTNEDGTLSQNALREIGKLMNYYTPETKIEINNEAPSTVPVFINFNDKRRSVPKLESEEDEKPNKYKIDIDEVETMFNKEEELEQNPEDVSDIIEIEQLPDDPPDDEDDEE